MSNEAAVNFINQMSVEDLRAKLIKAQSLLCDYYFELEDKLADSIVEDAMDVLKQEEVDQLLKELCPE